MDRINSRRNYNDNRRWMLLKNKYYPALTTIFAVAAFGMATGEMFRQKLMLAIRRLW